ncbi:MAG: fmt [Herbinix sp.]|jgi:methionyl-tRNA formyltransferase|nr:fmt [Herbinix sp.]
MKILYMGTPELAANILQRLIESEHEIIGVVTQPDKEKGRGKNVSCSPVKEVALQNEIPIYQPVKVREAGFVQMVREMAPEAIVVAAFGQILSKDLLEISPYGCINVHASLLPKYRGAAPIQYAVINGEKETGITIMYMDVTIDSGDIILQSKISLDPEETGGSLYDKLTCLGADLLLEALKKIEDGSAIRTPQDHAQATFVKTIDKTMGNINFTMPAEQIERLIRGLNPWPSAYTMLEGKTLKLWKATVEPTSANYSPGEIIEVRKDSFVVMTGDGALVIWELQLEGKKRMTTDAFLRGYTLKAGTLLGAV